MDLNFSFFVVVLISGALYFVRAALMRRLRTPWSLAHALVLTITVIGWFAWRSVSGFVALAALVAFLIAPARLAILTQHFATAQRWSPARRVARLVGVLHPSSEWRRAPALIDALALAHAGKLEEATQRLERLGGSTGAFADSVRLQILRFRDDWQGILDLAREHLAVARPPNADMVLYYIRALGEVGRISEMLEAHAALGASLPLSVQLGAVERLAVLAYCGRLDAVRRVLHNYLRNLPRATGELWQAVALTAAGNLDEARSMLDSLARRDSTDTVFTRAVERRLAIVADAPRPVELTERELHFVALLEQELEHDQAFGSQAHASFVRPVVTYSMSAAIVAVYTVEISQGATTSLPGLLQLGGLFVPLLEEGEYWRLVASMFLHYGIAHVALNLFALLAFGPWLESRLRHFRFAIVYLGSGLAAGATHVLLAWWYPSLRGAMLVGASGCIMGVLGASSAFLALGWRRTGARLARRRAIGLAGFVVLQSVFDLLIGNRALIAHLSGFVAGVVLGFVLAIGAHWHPSRAANAEAMHRSDGTVPRA